MAQPRPEVAVASVCLIAVLYNYEQWRDRERERRDGEKPGEGQKPAECHVKCTPHEGRNMREKDGVAGGGMRDAFVASERDDGS